MTTFAHEANATMHISDRERADIEARVSEALGGYIESTGKLDFSSWTPEEWDRFVSTAFDVISPDIFARRISVSGPFTRIDPPVNGRDVPY
jgi:hypothetical protein